MSRVAADGAVIAAVTIGQREDDDSAVASMSSY